MTPDRYLHIKVRLQMVIRLNNNVLKRCAVMNLNRIILVIKAADQYYRCKCISVKKRTVAVTFLTLETVYSDFTLNISIQQYLFLYCFLINKMFICLIRDNSYFGIWHQRRHVHACSKCFLQAYVGSQRCCSPFQYTMHELTRSGHSRRAIGIHRNPISCVRWHFSFKTCTHIKINILKYVPYEKSISLNI